MGEIITPPDDEPPFGPVPPGADCIICWGVGKPFGDIDTPDRIQVKFSGINKGPNWIPVYGEPLNGTYELYQLGGVPCAYRDNIAGLIIQFVMTAINTSVILHDFLKNANHFLHTTGICSLGFTNQENDRFVGGSAVVTIPETT